MCVYVYFFLNIYIYIRCDGDGERVEMAMGREREIDRQRYNIYIYKAYQSTVNVLVGCITSLCIHLQWELKVGVSFCHHCWLMLVSNTLPYSLYNDSHPFSRLICYPWLIASTICMCKPEMGRAAVLGSLGRFCKVGCFSYSI